MEEGRVLDMLPMEVGVLFEEPRLGFGVDGLKDGAFCSHLGDARL